MADPAIVAGIRGFIKAVEEAGIPVVFGVLYGSQAAGRAHQWSDIDLIVISPRYDGERRYDDISALWRIAARTDSRIEPVPCGERQWVEDDSSALLEIARREGEIIHPA